MKYTIFFFSCLLFNSAIKAMDSKEQVYTPRSNSSERLKDLRKKVHESFKDLKEAENLYKKQQTDLNKQLISACVDDYSTHLDRLMKLETQIQQQRNSIKAAAILSKKRTNSMSIRVESKIDTADAS